MKILWLAFSDMTSEPWITSLSGHDIARVNYNTMPIPCDRAVLDAVDRFSPDLVLYTGMAGGPHIPAPSTLRRIRAKAKLVLLTGDLCDPPWWPFLERYRADQCVDLVVNIDGNHEWPHREEQGVRILWLAPSDMTTEATIAGLTQDRSHMTVIHRYDKGPRPVDRSMLDIADATQPDLIVYLGQNGGPFVPAESTLARLKGKAPSVNLVFDGCDSTWTALLNQYARRDTFTLAVNIDGGMEWPGSERGLTLLTPVSPHFYANPPPLHARPIDFGFAGGYASKSRADIINHLIAKAGLVIHPRNERYGSYQGYADFMKSCKIVPNVPFSGSDNATQVKGRVVEAGWASCCLLEHRSAPTDRWFRPEFDYITYSEPEEAAQIASWLVEHPLEIAKFADRLHKRVVEEHSPSVFWAKVFKAIGL